GSGGGARRRVRGADRTGGREARGRSRDADLSLEDRHRRPQGGRAARGARRRVGGGGRPTFAPAARRGRHHDVGHEDEPRRGSRGRVAAVRHRRSGCGRDPARVLRPARRAGAAGDAGRCADALQQAARASRQAEPRQGGRGGAARAVPRLTMATQVFMEALSPTMEEGRVVKWHKREGDAVKAGDTLAEVETDKAIMDLVARADGVLRQVAVTEGQTVPVGNVVAVIAAPGENVDTSPAVAPVVSGSGGGRREALKDSPTVAGGGIARSAPTPVVAAPAAEAGRLRASPLAKRIARE